MKCVPDEDVCIMKCVLDEDVDPLLFVRRVVYVFMMDGFLCSVFGLVSVVSMDCAAPWRLQVNSELSWFHFSSPLMLLLLYNTVASLWRNQVTSHHT